MNKTLTKDEFKTLEHICFLKGAINELENKQRRIIEKINMYSRMIEAAKQEK